MTMITVTYGGEDLAVSYRPDFMINEILVHARRLFGTRTPGLSLFTEGGAELPRDKQAMDLLTPGMLVVMRPRVLH